MAGNSFRASEKISVHIVYGVLFTLIAIAGFIAFVLSRSLTDPSTQTASIGNAAPTFTANKIYLGTASDTTNWNTTVGPLTLTENTTTNVYVHGTANDTNGCTDISLANGTWTGAIYRANVTSAGSCSADNDACYALTESDMSASSTCSSTSLNFQFTKALQYYAEATDAGSTYAATNWDAIITVQDSSGSSTSATTAGNQTFEVSTLTALNVDASLAFGSVALGATSSEKTLAVTNTGNNTIDVQLSGTQFDCGLGGNFAATYESYNLTTGQSFASGTTLTGSAATVTTFNLSKANSDATTATKAIFWLLQPPSSGAGIGGTCTSTLTVTAVSG